MADNSYARSIELPPHLIFRNLNKAKKFAIDIGGSLAKLAYMSEVPSKKTVVSGESSEGEALSEIDHDVTKLHFIKFETKYLQQCLDFIRDSQLESFRPNGQAGMPIVKATGGGAFLYTDVISNKLRARVDKEDEMECLIKGCNFLLRHIPNEVFVFRKQCQPSYQFQSLTPDAIFPYLLVNIGSGVSIVKVVSDDHFERVGGTSTGGGTFWGLGSLLTNAKGFDELLDLAEKGDHRNVDLLVKDIYGGAYAALGLPPELIASSFGKTVRSTADSEPDGRQQGDSGQWKQADVVRSLLISISNDIGQIASLWARLHKLDTVYFGGYFIRGHPLTMHTITYAVNYWGKGEIKAMFLRHEGYLGAIGAFLKGQEEDSRATWSENFAASSGLRSPLPAGSFFDEEDAKVSRLELDRMDSVLTMCPLLADPAEYVPDMVDLIKDEEARQHWLNIFLNNVDKVVHRAVESQVKDPTVHNRARHFQQMYKHQLLTLKDDPCAYGALTMRSLLDMKEHCPVDSGFTDIFLEQKRLENRHALELFSNHLQSLDGLSRGETHLALVRGLLAGNMFDWGAKEVIQLMESGHFSFTDALDKLPDRPWLVDDFDSWINRQASSPYKQMAIFVDNSGMDVVLGVFPFVRNLLQQGTKVVLCSNSRPALNDVVHTELVVLVRQAATVCPVLGRALTDSRLTLMETGTGSPCVDLRHIDSRLAQSLAQCDLLVLEGMGRSVHTNLDTRFTCDVLKMAVIKDRWLAKNRLGGDMFSVIFRYEPRRKHSLGEDVGIR